jgi:hypothetical protein
VLSASGAVGDQIRVRILRPTSAWRASRPARSSVLNVLPAQIVATNVLNAYEVLAAVVLGEDGAGARTPEVLGGRHAAEALALWVVHAWAFDAWDISPFMVIVSPEKRCGKTTVLIILQFLTPRSELAAISALRQSSGMSRMSARRC